MAQFIANVGGLRNSDEGQVPAAGELRQAIASARPSNHWTSNDRQLVFDLVQSSIVRWVDDLERSLLTLSSALDRAASTTVSDGVVSAEGVEALEAAVREVASARDKLRAITALVGGAGIEPFKTGMRLNSTERLVRQLLDDWAVRGHAQAGRSKALFEQLAEHPSITLRNAALHALSPLQGVAPVSWVRVAHLDDRGGIVDWQRVVLYPEGTLDQENILRETVWRWGLSSATEAAALLEALTRSLAALFTEMGVIEPPQAVYRWPDGRIQMTRPG